MKRAKTHQSADYDDDSDNGVKHDSQQPGRMNLLQPIMINLQQFSHMVMVAQILIGATYLISTLTITV